MRGAWPLLGTLGIVSAWGAGASASTGGGSKKCAGSYANPVVNLCNAHFPDAKSSRVWMVVFYTTW